MVDISVSLVSQDQREDLEKLIPTIAVATARVDNEILLVDNCSTDGTGLYIRGRFPKICLHENRARRGYGENHNINLGRASGTYFVVMNSDMTVEPEVFARLTAYMDAHPAVGISSPRVLNEDGSIQGLNKRYPTLLDLFLRRFVPRPLQRPFHGRLAYYEMRDVGYDHGYDVPFLSGAFMFCRTGLLKSLGGFDPRYFLYFEDVDLCRRVQRTHRTVYVPDVSVTHCWKRAAHTNWTYTYHFLRSGLLYFTRWGIQLW